MDKFHKILKEYWGFDSFRAQQVSIMESILKGQDTLALMPTGGGKSICFQIPALLHEGICIVISPLVALMEDQVNQLKEKGIKALAIPSGLSFSALDALLDNCIYGNYKFLYLSPERLQQDIVQQRIQKMNVSLIAIDEAHCISQWGHDFRPSYIKIADLRELLPNTPILALTATATKQVQEDIITQLKFANHVVFQSSYKRDNLSYGIYKTQDKKYLLEQIVSKQKGATIVYVPTRKATETLSEYLLTKNILSVPYHGGLDTATKQLHFEEWMHDKVQVIVATNAFGMGIDKPNVRTVIHMHIPQSIESYFQETGRAGRDGKRSYALLLQTGSTVNKLVSQYESQTPDIDFIKHVYRKLSSYLQIGYGEGDQTTYPLVFSAFCERYKLSKAKVYASLKILDKNSILSFTETYTQTSKLQVLVSASRLSDYAHQQPNYGSLCSALARMYTGVFTHLVSIDLKKIAEAVNLSQSKIVEQLQKMDEQDLLTFENKKHDILLTYLQPREDEIAINSVSKHIKNHLKNRLQKVTDVVDFVENDTTCKSVLLLDYFGEASEACGICSVCVKQKKIEASKLIEIEEQITSKLSEGALDSRAIWESLEYPEIEVIRILRDLVVNGKVIVQPNNTYKLVSA